MITFTKLFGATLAMFLAALTTGCANQQGGATTQAMLQGAINAMGARMNGAAMGPGASVATSEAGNANSSGGKVVVINGTLIAVEGARPADPRWTGKRIKETSLFNFFAQHPISRPGEYFPRIGIRIDDFSQSLLTDNAVTKHLNGTPGATPRPLECIRFTAVVWMSEKQSQRMDNMVMCSSDIEAKDGYMSLGALRNYRNNLYAPISISSMQVRTLGPRVPAKLLPDFTQADITIYGQGQHLFSALFSQLGYNGPVDGDQRLWFVNLASPAK